VKRIALITLTLLLTSFTSSAYEMAITGGIQTTDVDSNGTSLDGTGFFAGILGFVEMNDSSYFRTGALLSQRKFGTTTAGVDFEATLTSIDVPVTYMHLFGENVGVFGGLKFGLNLDDDCEIGGNSCTLNDPETLHYAATFGGHFRFIPDFGLEVEYAMGLSELANNADWENSLAVGLFYMF
jgi:hypothetical protein